LVSEWEPLVKAEHNNQGLRIAADLAQLAGRLGQNEQQQQQQQEPLLQSAAEQKMHLLLPSVLLLNAAETPSSSEDAERYVFMSYIAAMTGISAIEAWKQQEELLTASMSAQGMQQSLLSMLQRTSGGTAPQQPGQQQAHAEHVANTVLDMQFVAAQVEETLHVVRFILKNLREMCRAEPSSTDRDFKASLLAAVQWQQQQYTSRGRSSVLCTPGFPGCPALHLCAE
jgi:hypothetical protein